MRSSKSRSRSKGNRNRSMGNIVNRVFDSSDPRGRCAAHHSRSSTSITSWRAMRRFPTTVSPRENFQQHAEHYLRMLSEAQREQTERQQQQGQQDQGGNQNAGDQSNRSNDNASQQGDQSGDRNQGAQGGEWRGGSNDRNRDRKPEAAKNDAPPPKATADVIDVEDDTDGGLVETPEDKPKRPRRPRAKPAAAAEPEKTEESLSERSRIGPSVPGFGPGYRISLGRPFRHGRSA